MNTEGRWWKNLIEGATYDLNGDRLEYVNTFMISDTQLVVQFFPLNCKGYYCENTQINCADNNNCVFGGVLFDAKKDRDNLKWLKLIEHEAGN